MTVLKHDPAIAPRQRLGGFRATGVEPFKRLLGRNLALIMFLVAYFLTFVLANLAYPFPIGDRLLGITAPHIDLSAFWVMRTLGYWILLFLPFTVVPIVAIGTRALLAGPVARLATIVPEFRKGDYAVILAGCYCYLLFAFWRADAFSLAWQGSHAGESGLARFELLAALGYAPQVVLKSLLMFLSVYSIVMALRTRDTFWRVASGFNFVAASLLLLHLNMKWPLLVFCLSVALCFVLFSQKWSLAKAAVALALLVSVYVGVSLSVFRLLPSVSAQTLHQTTGVLLVAVLNRMAMGYPFYYQVFTEKGQVCGTIVDRIQRKPSACQPSILISQTIMQDNDDKVTQPAPLHVSGYALGGWHGALIELMIAAVVIGGFISLPFGAHANTTVSTMAIMGGLAGYYFTQLPVEGAIIYDHGMVWWLGLCAAYAAFRWALAVIHPSAG